MNYTKIYKNLINSRQLMSRTKGDGLFESHHISPKCIGGSDESDNLVLLTPREHYIAHWLLYKSYTGIEKSKLAYAFLKMCSSNKNQTRNVTSEQYERAKEAMSNISGINHPAYGRKHTEESKKKMSIATTGSKNSMYGKEPWNKGLSKETSPSLQQSSDTFKTNYSKENNPRTGKPRDEITKQKISESHKGKTKSKDHKNKISKTLKGRKLPDITKQRMSEARKGKEQKQVTCPHCGKSGGEPSMKRWHFDKCKFV